MGLNSVLRLRLHDVPELPGLMLKLNRVLRLRLQHVYLRPWGLRLDRRAGCVHRLLAWPDYCAINRHRRLVYRDDGGRWLLAFLGVCCILSRQGQRVAYRDDVGGQRLHLARRGLRLAAHNDHQGRLLRACAWPVGRVYVRHRPGPQHDEGGDSERRGGEDEHGSAGVNTGLVVVGHRVQRRRACDEQRQGDHRQYPAPLQRVFVWSSSLFTHGVYIYTHIHGLHRSIVRCSPGDDRADDAHDAVGLRRNAGGFAAAAAATDCRERDLGC
jgi:hypothetical protein